MWNKFEGKIENFKATPILIIAKRVSKEVKCEQWENGNFYHQSVHFGENHKIRLVAIYGFYNFVFSHFFNQNITKAKNGRCLLFH